MRLLAIGDIHGCYRAFTTVVEAAKVMDDDLVVTLGDYVDRGPDSAAVLNWLVGRSKHGRLIALAGNHELMMLRAKVDPAALADWLSFGGDATLASYPSPTEPPGLQVVPQDHWNFLADFCREWYETETHFFVHANADPDLDMEDQADYMLFWEKFHDPPPHRSGKIMVCGHTPQKSGRPRNIGHAVCIDTMAYSPHGWLTCLEVATGRYWQANEQGESREDWRFETQRISVAAGRRKIRFVASGYFTRWLVCAKIKDWNNALNTAMKIL